MRKRGGGCWEREREKKTERERERGGWINIIIRKKDNIVEIYIVEITCRERKREGDGE